MKKLARLKFDEAIAMLNDTVAVKIAPSQVHGVGVVALRDIKKGEKLYLDAIPNAFDLPYKEFKKLLPHVRETILGMWPQVINGSHFLYPVTRMVAYMNHSETPNYDAKDDVALVDIKEGEELFEDYRVVENYKKIYPWIVS